MTFFAQLLGKITVVRFQGINSAKCCLKTAGYLFPARNLMAFASHEYEEIFIFEDLFRGTQRQFSENICSEDDLRSRIFGAFVVKFRACLPLLGFSNI